jgi:putative transposase
VQLLARSPDLSPHIEPFMRTVKDECLHRMVFFGEMALGNVVREFLIHYHEERNHKGSTTG